MTGKRFNRPDLFLHRVPLLDRDCQDDQAMTALITTLGALTAAQLGMILPHEHVFVDLRTPDHRVTPRLKPPRWWL